MEVQTVVEPAVGALNSLLELGVVGAILIVSLAVNLILARMLSTARNNHIKDLKMFLNNGRVE